MGYSSNVIFLQDFTIEFAIKFIDRHGKSETLLSLINPQANPAIVSSFSVEKLEKSSMEAYPFYNKNNI